MRSAEERFQEDTGRQSQYQGALTSRLGLSSWMDLPQPCEAEAVIELIERLKRSASVIVIIHNLQHISYVVGRILALRHGEVVETT